MPIPIVDEATVEELDLPGRKLRWVISQENTGAQYCTMAVIHVGPGQRVRPAHSHPNGEEVIYILSGHGRVLVDGEVELVRTGCAVLFPKGKIHMLENLSDIEMKVACFFSPPASLANYQFFEDIDFPI
ncbi:cupin domain-containing protein [Edaphobacter albus]|uniref:cupin domain-containing protein n=1 Tax=Edaphobacter sp. 4G125 TaxID=2763071 RepID=UPI0016444A77|nr:cupin domain-containing protein [Edaphobacter sp. 4G125]QNI36452.1 cupin domain-containing protein [Edaphobacter sp. 4G125]